MRKAIVTLLAGTILTAMAAAPAFAASTCRLPGASRGLQLPNCISLRQCNTATADSTTNCLSGLQSCGDFSQLFQLLTGFCGR